MGGNPKIRRAIAWAGIIALAGLYVNLLIQALTASPDTAGAFITCAAATVAIPILIWIILWIYSKWSNNKK